MSLKVRTYGDVGAFLGATGAFLARREAEHNLIFGISSWLRSNPELVREPPTFHAVTRDDDDRIVAASLRTPPHNQVLSMVDDPDAVDVLADALRGTDLPGVLGPKEAAARFVRRWSASTGVRAHVQTAERIFRLERVVPPSPASGRWRFLELGDKDLLVRWILAFSAEAMPEDPAIEDPEAVAQRWIDQVGRIGYVWEDGGVPVCLVGASGETPNGIRIGPVYTPPERRRRGYASALTAAASQDQLDRGRRFCFLFTDLANPTSNKIYRAVGYEPVCDVDMYRFEADA